MRYLLFGVLVNQVGAFAQTFLLLYLTQARHWSLGAAGLVLTLYSTGSVLGSMLGGELVPRLGPRLTIAAAMFASGATVGLVPWVAGWDHALALGALAALAGLVTQSYRPAAAVLLSDYMPERYRVMSFSMMRMALNVGAAVGPVLAAAIVLVDWSLLFWFDAATAVAYAALALFLLPRSHRPPAAAGGSPGTAGTAGGAAGEGPAAEPLPWTGRAAYRALAGDRRYLLYLAGMLLSAGVYVQYTVVLPLKVAAEGYPTAWYSAALVTSSLVLVTCELAVTTYVRRWRAATAGGIGTALLTLGVAGYGLAGLAPAVVLLSTLVFVAGLMTSGPTMFAFPAQAPAPVRSRYIAVSQAAFSIGAATGPAAGVLVWRAWGDGVWSVCLAVGLLSAAAAWAGMRRTPAGHLTPTPPVPVAG